MTAVGFLPITAGEVSTSFALPGMVQSPTDLDVVNLGPSAVSVVLGDSSVTATLSDMGILPGKSARLAIGSSTYISAIAGPQGCASYPELALIANLSVVTRK